MSQDNNVNLRTLLHENKLTHINYLDWEQSLRIVLKQHRMLYVINYDPLSEPDKNGTDEEFIKYEKFLADKEDVSCIILASISTEFQKQCENMECWEMMKFLRDLLKEKARQMRKESWYGKCPNPTECQRATKKSDKLRTCTRSHNKKKIPKEDRCFHCGVKGHWKRNCNEYLKVLKKKRAGVTANPTGIYFIEVNNFSVSDSLVLDTGAASHICVNLQGLKNRRKLNKGKVHLRVGNGSRIAALEVGDLDIALPSGLVLELEYIYYVPAMSRNIISISCLNKIGFSMVIKDKCCSIYKDNVFYCSASMINGLNLLNLERSVYNIIT